MLDIKWDGYEVRNFRYSLISSGWFLVSKHYCNNGQSSNDSRYVGSDGMTTHGIGGVAAIAGGEPFPTREAARKFLYNKTHPRKKRPPKRKQSDISKKWALMADLWRSPVWSRYGPLVGVTHGLCGTIMACADNLEMRVTMLRQLREHRPPNTGAWYFPLTSVGARQRAELCLLIARETW